MISALLYLAALLGLWLAASPFALGRDSAVTIAVDVVAGVAAMVLGVVGARKTIARLGVVVAAIGVALAVWGVIGTAVPAIQAGPNEIVVGIVLLVVGAFAAAIVPAQHVRAYDMYGATLADISKISVKKGDIAATAVLLESMPSTLYLRPEEVWKLLGLLTWDTVRHLPAFLLAGARRSRPGRTQSDGKSAPTT